MKKVSRLIISLSTIIVSACQTFNSVPNVTNEKPLNINNSTYDFDFSTKSECYGYGCDTPEPISTPTPYNPKPSPLYLVNPNECKIGEIIDLSTVKIAPWKHIFTYDFNRETHYANCSASIQNQNYLSISCNIEDGSYMSGSRLVGVNGKGYPAGDVPLKITYSFSNTIGLYDFNLSIQRDDTGGTNLVQYTGSSHVYPMTSIEFSRVKDTTPISLQIYENCKCNNKLQQIENFDKKIKYENELINYYSIKISDENSKEKPNQTQISNWQKNIDQSFKDITKLTENHNLKEQEYNDGTCVKCEEKKARLITKIDNTEESLDSLANIAKGIEYINSQLESDDEVDTEDGQLGTFSTKAANNLPVDISQGEYNRALALKQAFYEVDILQYSDEEIKRQEFINIVAQSDQEVLNKIDNVGIDIGASTIILKGLGSLSSKAFVYVVNHPKFINWMTSLKNLSFNRTGLQTCPVAINTQEINSFKNAISTVNEKIQSIVKSVGTSTGTYWRGRSYIPQGNSREGWIHIVARHITGTDPGGDLFIVGTTQKMLEKAAQTIIDKGNRLSKPSQRMQVFEKRIIVNKQKDLVRIFVDSYDGKVVTIFPVRGGGIKP